MFDRELSSVKPIFTGRTRPQVAAAVELVVLGRAAPTLELFGAHSIRIGRLRVSASCRDPVNSG
jgi:hypothetical protein